MSGIIKSLEIKIYQSAAKVFHRIQSSETILVEEYTQVSGNGSLPRSGRRYSPIYIEICSRLSLVNLNDLRITNLNEYIKNITLNIAN